MPVVISVSGSESEPLILSAVDLEFSRRASVLGEYLQKGGCWIKGPYSWIVLLV